MTDLLEKLISELYHELDFNDDDSESSLIMEKEKIRDIIKNLKELRQTRKEIIGLKDMCVDRENELQQWRNMERPEQKLKAWEDILVQNTNDMMHTENALKKERQRIEGCIKYWQEKISGAKK